jgi:hypothetical protein
MYDGQSLDVSLDNMDIGTLSDDQQIKQAVASHLDVPITKLANFDIDRNTLTGDITLRPRATFG